MAYTFDVEGWEDWKGDRHPGTPSDLDATHGLFVHVYDAETEEDRSHFWAYVLFDAFHDWAEWWVYIGSLMEMHGMTLA